ncbi:MAG: hypothetical protein U9Q20_07740 [Campylobacterota bacterium]|nr:hypothetical protein [Campylobacterota bacterium]
MPQESNKEKTQKILKKTNDMIGSKTLLIILFLLITVVIVYMSKALYATKTDEYKNKIYTKIDQNIQEQYNIMLKEKLDTSTLVSSSLSKNNSIKKALIANNSTKLDLEKLLDEMKTTKEYVDIQAEVIDAEGISFKRSWTYLSGDDLIQNDQKLAHLIKYPRVDTTIEATKYGLTFTNKIPIYDNDKFLGLFGVNIHFDALVDIMSKNGFDSIVLLNEDDSKKIVQELSYSKKFVDDCYVVNSNANKYLLKVLKQNGIDKFCDNWENSFIVNEQSSHLVSKIIIKDSDNIPIAKAIVFKSIDEIDFDDLEFFQQTHIISTILLILLVAFIVNYISLNLSVKEFSRGNDALVLENNELQVKANELDYKEKELDNLFDNQPNVMFMHNAKVITKVNRRFIKGFFRRFKTYEGFRDQHSCVSELFEQYDGQNYICSQVIDKKYWIDYILDDPRKLYKAVMSVDGDPHHFIVKLNEMEFNKKSSERVIIVALVDVTQDILNNTLGSKTVEQKKEEPKVKEEIKKVSSPKKEIEVKGKENKKVEQLPEVSEVQKPAEIPTKKEPVKKPIIKNDIKQENKNVPTATKKEEVKKSNKLDAYGLIQSSFATVLQDTILNDVLSEKITVINSTTLNGQNILRFDNKFEILNKKDPLVWRLLIPIESLSKVFNIMVGEENQKPTNEIDEGLMDIAEALVESMGEIIKKNTKNQVKLAASSAIIQNNTKMDSSEMKLFDLGYMIGNKKFPIFLMLDTVKR